jgi:hypothetical protein
MTEKSQVTEEQAPDRPGAVTLRRDQIPPAWRERMQEHMDETARQRVERLGHDW